MVVGFVGSVGSVDCFHFQQDWNVCVYAPFIILCGICGRDVSFSQPVPSNNKRTKIQSKFSCVFRVQWGNNRNEYTHIQIHSRYAHSCAQCGYRFQNANKIDGSSTKYFVFLITKRDIDTQRTIPNTCAQLFLFAKVYYTQTMERYFCAILSTNV